MMQERIYLARRSSEWNRGELITNSVLTIERELQIVYLFSSIATCDDYIHALFDTHSETRSLSAEHTHGNFQLFGLVVTLSRGWLCWVVMCP